MLAAASGNVNIVKRLLDLKAGVVAKDKYGYTALLIAAEHGHEGIVKIVAAVASGNEGAVKLLQYSR